MFAERASAFGVSLITLLAFQHRTAGVVESFSFEIEVQGSELVSATVTPPGKAPIALPADGSGEFFFSSADYPTSEALDADFPEGSYLFAIVGSATSISGTLEYAHSPTQGFVAIDAPKPQGSVGPFPTFGVTNGCTNCSFFIAEVEDLASSGDQVWRETPFGFPVPPLFAPTLLTLDDLSVGSPLPGGLPSDSYTFRANGVSGSLLQGHALAGDSSGVRFAYGSGDEDSNRIEFSAPEPAALSLELAAALALAALRRASRVARPAPPPA